MLNKEAHHKATLQACENLVAAESVAHGATSASPTYWPYCMVENVALRCLLSLNCKCILQSYSLAPSSAGMLLYCTAELLSVC